MTDHYTRLLTDDEALRAFIAEQEAQLLTPARDLAPDILRQLAAQRDRREWSIRSRLLAVSCFAAAACVLCLTGFGLFQNIFAFLTSSASEVSRLIETLVSR